jgi:AraC-like DNA-binding protein
MQKNMPLPMQRKILKNIRDIQVANFFRPKPGHNVWGPRTIKDFEFVYNVRGETVFKDKARTCFLQPGDLLLIAPDSLHTVYSIPEKGTIISCIHFSLLGVRLETCVFRQKEDPVLLSFFRECAEEMQFQPQLYKEAMEILVQRIWLRLFRLQADEQRKNEPRRISKLLEFMEKNYSKPLTRESLAAQIGVTPQHLDHLFKQSKKQSPMRILESIRMRKARQLLSNPVRTVSAVARMVGYLDPFYFSKVFRKYTGISPARFKERL